MQDVDWNLECAEPIKPSDSHYVLVEWPITVNEAGVPRPQAGRHHWNNNFVRLPCHPESKIQIEAADGEKIWISRWERIQEAFSTKISTSKELEAAILSYNPKFKDKWKFKALHKMFDDLDEDEAAQFFDHLLPKIIELALRLPQLVQWSIPMVKQQQNFSVSMSQQQIASLLANAFLCTFPMRNNNVKAGEYSSFGDINFTRMLQGTGSAVIQKILCICHYFRTITDTPRSGMVTFTRRCVSAENLPKWETLDMQMGTTDLKVNSTGTIEDSHGMLQADFANKYIGGGVLGHGCVQEEIRFVICPELIVSKLFMECMKNNEAIWVVGCERFSRYTGYAGSFRWDGPYEDKTPNDSSWRKKTTVTAIDALRFHQSSHQFREELMVRELNKAYVGFYHDLNTPPSPIASGNWGCGAFGGEPLLKSLLQLIVCTAINRSMVYYTFGNTELKENIDKMYKFLQRNSVTVTQLMSYLRKFSAQKLKPQELYSYIYQSFYDGGQPQASSSTGRTLPPLPTQKKTILSFFKPLKAQQPLSEVAEMKKFVENAVDEIEQQEETVETPQPEDKMENLQLNEEPVKAVSLSAALDSSYYEEAPLKKLCMDVS